MVMQLFRVQLLDQALAAMVAVTVWAVLASDRFARTPQSVLAGVLLGVAMLVKAPAPAFVAGAVAVAIALGGWRRPRNLGLAAAATLIVAGPYYAIHLSDYLSLSNQAVVASQDPWTLSFGWTFEGERRLTLESFAWYVWTAINTQYLVPLLCLFAVGLVSALGDLRQRRYVPELLGGLVVGYLAMTLLSVHDPRYTLPLAVYVAVLATGWIATAQRRWVTIAGTACLLAIVCLNVAASTFGLLPTVKLTPLAGDEETDLIHPGALTLLDKRGFYVGEPHSDGTWRDLLDAMDREGLHSAELRFYEVPLMGTDVYGFQVAAESAHDISFPQPDPLTSHVGERLDAVIVRPQVVITTWWSPEPPLLGSDGVRALPAPCTSIEDGVVPPEVEGKQLQVLVERLEGERYVRWCDFPELAARQRLTPRARAAT